VEWRIRAAHFPAVKSLDTFDFTAIPSLNKMLVTCQALRRVQRVDGQESPPRRPPRSARQ
jgi:DNA replication protein DnaC